MTALNKLKAAVDAPIPSASEQIATAAKVGLWRNMRIAILRS
jgi:hypothetical protein